MSCFKEHEKYTISLKSGSKFRSRRPQWTTHLLLKQFQDPWRWAGWLFSHLLQGKRQNLTYHVIERNMSSQRCFILLCKLFQRHDKDSMANIMIFYILHPLWWLFLIHYFWMSLSMLYILLHSGPGPGFIYIGYFILSLLNPPASLTFMPRNGHRVFPFYNSYMQKIHPSQECPFHPQEESGPPDSLTQQAQK